MGVINISHIEELEYKTIVWSDNNGKCLVIHRLAIHPKNQKQGLAGKLMGFAESFAIENGYTSIRLDAYSGNERVLRFYENRGYQKRGEVNFSGRALPFFLLRKRNIKLISNLCYWFIQLYFLHYLLPTSLHK